MTPEYRNQPQDESARAPGERFFARVARLAPSQLPPLLSAAEHLAHRHVDDAHRHFVAGLPSHQIALLLGTVGFAGQIPTFLLAPIAGVIVDRIDRRKVLVWTQSLAMVQSLALAWLTLSHRITIAEMLALSVDAGHHQRIRHARPPVVHGQDGRETAPTSPTPSPSTPPWSTRRA